MQAIGDNDESLKELMTRIEKQAETVQEFLSSGDTAHMASTKMKEDFARTLLENLCELQKLENNRLWRNILENEQVKAEIQRILRKVDENTKNFYLKVMFNIERNTFAILEKLEQMKDLLAMPWQKFWAKCAAHLPPHLIVIDALDEIEEKKGSDFLKELLTIINDYSLSGLKFLVTSRPDPDLALLCESYTSNIVCHLYDVAKEEIQEDIHKYLNANLLKLQNDDKLVNLATKADGLFIYASTAVKYISYPEGCTAMEQQRRLNKLLEPIKA
ncbi:hypothetical protein C0992_000125 [Termitomyces sp. T32_za158]|nr:hypothetical protein C0992_000125 [Termitomyces sp. T32_za158]